MSAKTKFIMRKCIILFGLILFLGSVGFSQTIKPKNFIVSSIVPDDFMGRSNIGVEYFIDFKKNDNLSPISFSLNAGTTSTTILNQKIKGIDFIGEINSYGTMLISEKWNEYGGLKLSYGNFNNETLNEDRRQYFIGITTGIQPIILKRIALKMNSDIGYMKNGFSRMSFFGSNDQVFFSGFTINFNLGLGIRF